MAQAAAEASKYDGGTASGAFIIGLLFMGAGFVVSFFSGGGQYVFYLLGLAFWATAAAILMGAL